MSSGSRVTTSDQRQQYQGYPYVNPPAFGVPTIDAHTATRWANLPRRPIGTAVRIQDQAGSSGSQSHQNTAKTPEDTISYVSDDEPVLYIDLPDAGESDLYERRVDTPTQNSTRLQAKPNDEDEEPVVYIDIPECSGSGVSERRPEVEDGPSTTIVQETIFYDQFKDRRIDVMPVDSRNFDNDSTSSNNSTMRRPFGNSNSYSVHRPEPPTSLNVWSLGTSMANTGASTSSELSRPTPTYLPSYLTPQEYQEAFRTSPHDDFRLPPLPVTDFPEPPPAYTEFDLRSPPPSLGNTDVGYPVPQLGSARSISVITEQPQRTTVIAHENSGLSRKFLMCQHCRVTVQSIMVREAWIGTHIAAICFLLFGCLPCTILVYVTDFCKGKNYYCPNCNERINKTN